MTSPARDGLLDLLRRRIVVAPMAGGPTTAGLVAAAAARGDTEGMSLWAGQGYRQAAERPAAEIVERLRG